MNPTDTRALLQLSQPSKERLAVLMADGTQFLPANATSCAVAVGGVLSIRRFGIETSMIAPGAWLRVSIEPLADANVTEQGAISVA